MILYGSAHPVLLAAAIIPAVILMIYVYRVDRMEPEPIRLLLSLLVFGVLSTGLAMVTERLGKSLLPLFFREGSREYYRWLCFGVIALSEEGFKFLLLKRRTWRSPHFNCQFDGVVYAVFVALGFALWENIGYVLAYGFQAALLRAVTAVPGHACFGVFMGAWYGLAKRACRPRWFGLSRLCQWLAVLIPVLLHGAYDYIALTEQRYAWLFFAFTGVMFLVAFLLVRKLSDEDRYI